MTKFLLTLHVLAAIISVGPVTVAAGMFPAAARRAATAEGAALDNVSTVRLLHRICNVYAVLGLAVPVLGFTTANMMHVLGSPWVITSIALTALAAILLGIVVLPSQEAVLDTLTATAAPAESGVGQVAAGSARALAGANSVTKAFDPAATARLGILTGVFNLLWATVTVLMIVRPGSTTGT